MSLTTDQNGDIFSEGRYLPYGEERWTDGASPTNFGFTGQRNEASFDLMDYNARYYSPVLGRFISPDSIVPEPESSSGFNRYRYARNNPLKYTNPSGYCEKDSDGYKKCIEIANRAKELIGSDTTADGVSLYDLNWTLEEQADIFAQAHFDFIEISKTRQEQMVFLDFWSDHIPDFIEAIQNEVVYEFFDGTLSETESQLAALKLYSGLMGIEYLGGDLSPAWKYSLTINWYRVNKDYASNFESTARMLTTSVVIGGALGAQLTLSTGQLAVVGMHQIVDKSTYISQRPGPSNPPPYSPVPRRNP